MTEEILEFISEHNVDGAHHKQWLIDQIVRMLTETPEAYEKWVANYEQDGEYEWETGIAP